MLRLVGISLITVWVLASLPVQAQTQRWSDLEDVPRRPRTRHAPYARGPKEALHRPRGGS